MTQIGARILDRQSESPLELITHRQHVQIQAGIMDADSRIRNLGERSPLRHESRFKNFATASVRVRTCNFS